MEYSNRHLLYREHLRTLRWLEPRVRGGQGSVYTASSQHRDCWPRWNIDGAGPLDAQVPCCLFDCNIYLLTKSTWRGWFVISTVTFPPPPSISLHPRIRAVLLPRTLAFVFIKQIICVNNINRALLNKQCLFIRIFNPFYKCIALQRTNTRGQRNTYISLDRGQTKIVLFKRLSHCWNRIMMWQFKFPELIMYSFSVLD